jgi:membrane protein implicated in regulation of membrane protease activity
MSGGVEIAVYFVGAFAVGLVAGVLADSMPEAIFLSVVGSVVWAFQWYAVVLPYLRGKEEK